MLIFIENHRICEVRTPYPPLDPHMYFRVKVVFCACAVEIVELNKMPHVSQLREQMIT